MSVNPDVANHADTELSEPEFFNVRVSKKLALAGGIF